MSHTPAPWRLSTEYGCIHASNPGVIEGSKVICDINATNPRCEANANLIAAAPELLEALEKAIEEMRLNYEHGLVIDIRVLQAANQAIKKARDEA